MFINAGEFDKVKAAERAEHALKFSDLDRTKQYDYDAEMSKSAYEKEEKRNEQAGSEKKDIKKILEVVAFVIVVGIVFTFFNGIF